jgi:SAM-dependent methyltransferase
MLAIDRSRTQIERARRLNEAHVAAGRLTLETAAIEDLDACGRQFDKVFAVNVNAFWTGSGERELDSVSRALGPGGRLFLFYEAPSAERAREVSGRIAVNLEAAGFPAPDSLAPFPTRVCVSAPVGGAPSP